MRGTGDDKLIEGEPATTRLSAFGSLEGTELAGLAQLAGPERRLGRRDVLWEEGKRLPALFVLLEGWMVSSMSIAGRELTLRVHLPGDVLGLPSLAFSTAAETTVALTAAKLRPLALHSLGHLFEAYPRIAAMMFLVSQQERVDLLDRLASAYTAPVVQRLATFFLHLFDRVNRSFPGTGDSFFLPVTRQHVADIIGAGQTHLADALKQLRAANILGWNDRFVTIMDPQGLSAFASLPPRQLVQDAHWLPTFGEEG